VDTERTEEEEKRLIRGIGDATAENKLEDSHWIGKTDGRQLEDDSDSARRICNIHTYIHTHKRIQLTDSVEQSS
jgi:hypothetical protein